MEAKRKVQTEEAQLYAEENQIIYMETSAKSSQNVRNLFNEIAKKLPRYVSNLLSRVLVIYNFPAKNTWMCMCGYLYMTSFAR